MYSKMLMFQTTQGLASGASNLLVANMYQMVALKIHVFDAYVFEETPNKSIIRFGNHFYHGCPRVSPFPLNNLDNELGNEK